MRNGFHVFIDKQGRLTQYIVEGESVREFPPEDMVDNLNAFARKSVSQYSRIIIGLGELPIFSRSLDIRHADFLECKELCYDIANAAKDIVTKYFMLRELDLINSKPDDGSASFWIYQARRMVDAVAIPMGANRFIKSALVLLCASSDTMIQRMDTFFKVYPQWKDHVFAETFRVIPNGGKQETVSIQIGHIIRTYEELLFYELLELIRRAVWFQRCECCGGCFIPKTKKKTLYCDSIIKDGKTCKQIAPKLKQELTKRRLPALAEYDRLYKMYYARAERYENRTDVSRERTDNDMTYIDFSDWSERAGEERIRYIQGEISGEELIRRITIGKA